MAEPPTILITAASGNIGKRLVPLLLSDPSQPRLVLPTRNADKLRQLIPEDHASRVFITEGSLQDPHWLEGVIRKHHVQSVFLCLTGENELLVTLNFFDAMQRSGCVKHLVYVSACGSFSGFDAIEQGSLKDMSAGHVVVKFILEQKLAYGLPTVEEGGFSWSIVGPTLFFDNDLRSKMSLFKAGIFNEPLGNGGISRVSPEDIALVSQRLLLDSTGRWTGKKIMIGSGHRYTAAEIESLWSKVLGKNIKLAPSDENGLRQLEEHYKSLQLSPTWARDIRLMYETFAKHGFGMNEEEYKEQIEVLGREPRSYEQFVEETGKMWKAELLNQ
jgi:uncharacterized protein YbjT (DUF2867 family)